MKLETLYELKCYQKVFSKDYDVQTNQKLFVVHSISANLPIPMYQNKSIDNPEDVRTGQFHGHELKLY